MPSRRDFMRASALTGIGATTGFARGVTAAAVLTPAVTDNWHRALDLAPARWIWLPSGRTLANSMVLFRRTFDLAKTPRGCTGWLLAESRYKLWVNGHYVQFGPAPSDPRTSEADPLDAVAPFLRQGRNTLAVQVLFYGNGDGTWPIGKPGLLARIDIATGAGTRTVVSDGQWRTLLARAWRPGQYKRWYLRALQEERDERLHPVGWTSPAFDDARWRAAMPVAGRADRPSLCNAYPDYLYEVQGDPEKSELRARSVALLREETHPVNGLAEHRWIDWHQPAEDYFDMLAPNSFSVVGGPSLHYDGTVTVPVSGNHAAALTFALPEQMVGWPVFEINAPAGTIVELIVHEGHAPGGPPLLNTHFNSWTRFICRKGVNRFETFDFESLRWLQLHVRGHHRAVTIRGVGVRRRTLPRASPPQVALGDAKVQKVINAALNTLANCAQDTIVDGMARERQQYSGDGSHQLHALYAQGERRLPGRFVDTFGQGMSLDGVFLDCWPAYDRLARVAERQLGLTPWGPILDHSIGFGFDCWYYHLYTGETGALAHTFPNLLIFFDRLQSFARAECLLPVENLGLAWVWIDHDAYLKPSHKQCALNLYAAAMCEHALAPLAAALGSPRTAEIAAFGAKLRQAAIRRFWSASERAFVANLPWAAAEGGNRFCDRSLATSVLFRQCPGGNIRGARTRLIAMPADTGRSYPANAVWRYWALARLGAIETVLDELRTRWFPMASVQQNNTLQEFWTVEPDSTAQWSHCCVAPLVLAHMGIAGVWPTVPGHRACDIRPQFGSLGETEIVTQTVAGPIRVAASGALGNRRVLIDVPAGVSARLILPGAERIARQGTTATGGLTAYPLAGPFANEFVLRTV